MAHVPSNKRQQSTTTYSESTNQHKTGCLVIFLDTPNETTHIYSWFCPLKRTEWRSLSS